MPEAAGHEPKTLLRRTLPHISQFAVWSVAPNLPDPFRDSIAEQTTHQFLLGVVAGSKNQEIRLLNRAILEQRALRYEALDLIELQQPDFSLDDKSGTTHVQV